MRKIVFLIAALAAPTVLLAQTTTDTSLQAPNIVPLTLTKTEDTAMQSTNDIVTNISRSPELASFYKYVQSAGLAETFKSQGPITVFAPDNRAFTLLAKGKRDTLKMASHKYDLIALLTYHAMPGVVTSKDISKAINAGNGTATFTTLAGNKLTANLDSNRNIVLTDENGGRSVINKFDVSQSNGLLHIVNAVLVPRFKGI